MKKVSLFLIGVLISFLGVSQNDNSNKNATADSTSTQKEETRKFRSWSVGADLGWSLLFGDLHQGEANKQDFNNDFGGFDFGFSVNLQKWYSSAWGWRGRAGWLTYSGSKGVYGVDASTFRGEFGVQLNLSGIGQRNRTKERKDAWIVNAGFGYTWANAIVYKNGEEFLKLGSDQLPQFISDNQKEERSHNTVYMPFGIEWRYRFAERWDFKAAIDATWAMDDNMDGSETAAKVDWNDPVNDVDALGLVLGNTTNDFLVYFNVGVNYHFSWFKPHQDATPIIYVGPGDVNLDGIRDSIGMIMADADDDGVSDYFDKEPDTPEGYMVYGGGQCVDIDRDGICDDIDQDPYSCIGGKVDANGRDIDTDGDGVPDCRDLEDTDTSTVKMVNFQGRGIIHPTDAFLQPIYFAFNSHKISDANEPRLAAVARFLRSNPDAKIEIYGHTDLVGSEQYNKYLSERRAKAVEDALEREESKGGYGIAKERIKVVEWEGETNPFKKTDKATVVNRRVEFKVVR